MQHQHAVSTDKFEKLKNFHVVSIMLDLQQCFLVKALNQ